MTQNQMNEVMRRFVADINFMYDLDATTLEREQYMTARIGSGPTILPQSLYSQIHRDGGAREAIAALTLAVSKSLASARAEPECLLAAWAVPLMFLAQSVEDVLREDS